MSPRPQEPSGPSALARPLLVFIHINKTGGRTVRYILRSTFGLRHCEVEPWHSAHTDPPFSSQDLQRLRRLYPTLESIGGHRVRGHVDLGAPGRVLRYFTLMRDPLKTCASRFQYNVQYRRKTGLVFEKWIQQEWPRNSQTKMIAGEPDVAKAIRVIQEKQIFVGLTERFDESMVLFKTLMADHLNISYRPVNQAGSNAIAETLLSTEKTRHMLIDANRADLELYDIVRQDLYPAYQRAYGPSLEDDVTRYRETRESRFNAWNVTLSRVKQYALYKPVLYLHRSGVALF